MGKDIGYRLGRKVHRDGMIPYSLTATVDGGQGQKTSVGAPFSVNSLKMGCSVPNQAMNAGSYDAGMTQAAADTKFWQIVGRGLGGAHPPVTKKFWNPSNWNTSANDLQNYVAFGTTVIMCVQPALAGGDQAALAAFLSTIKGFGFNAQNCIIVPWQEPEVGTKNLSPSGYQSMLTTYGPTINASGLPLVCDIGSGNGPNTVLAYGNAAIAAMQSGVQLAGLAQDYYAGAYFSKGNGVTLDGLAGLADANNLPYGVFEHGILGPGTYTVAQGTQYMSYIYSFMLGRLKAGKPCLPVLYYDGQGSPTGQGDITSPIGQDPSVTSPDYRIALFQQGYDSLCAMS